VEQVVENSGVDGTFVEKADEAVGVAGVAGF
jgi:hypothetical protein